MTETSKNINEQIKEELLQRYNDVEKEIEQINIQIEELKLRKKRIKKGLINNE